MDFSETNAAIKTNLETKPDNGGIPAIENNASTKRKAHKLNLP
jgi:hypothetical protein